MLARDIVLERDGRRNDVEFSQSVGELARRREVGRQHVREPGRGFVFPREQFVEGRNRFATRISQEHVVGVEGRIRKRGNGGESEHECRPANQGRPTFDHVEGALFEFECVRRHRGRVTAQPGRKQRGKEGCREEKHDEHAAAGDEPELGHAQIVGGDEYVEAGRGRHRADEKRASNILERLVHRSSVICTFTPGSGIVHAEMDRKIDAEPDE